MTSRIDGPSLALTCCLALISCADSERENLKAALAAKDARIRQLEGRVNTLEKRLGRTESSSARLNETIQSLERRMRAMGAVDRRLRQLRTDIESRLAADSQRELIHSLMSDLEDQLEAKARRAAALSADLSTAKREISNAGRAARFAARIAQIESDLERSRTVEAELRQQVVTLQIQLGRAQSEITGLTNERTSLLSNVDEQNQQISRLQSGLKTVLVSGKVKDLRRKGVLRGRAWQRKVPTCSACPTCLVDIDRDTTWIPIPEAKTIRVLTSHPSGSFKIASRSGVRGVEIIEPSRFWEFTRCVVVGF